jgi:hypothetical protein
VLAGPVAAFYWPGRPSFGSVSGTEGATLGRETARAWKEYVNIVSCRKVQVHFRTIWEGAGCDPKLNKDNDMPLQMLRKILAH